MIACKCPGCGLEFEVKSPAAVRNGKKGGSVKGVAKGFANPAVMAKALETRRRRSAG